MNDLLKKTIWTWVRFPPAPQRGWVADKSKMKTDEVFVFFPEATTHPTTQKRGCMPRIRRTFGKKTRKFDEQTFENDFRYPKLQGIASANNSSLRLRLNAMANKGVKLEENHFPNELYLVSTSNC